MDSTVNISHLTQNGYIFKDHSHHVITFPIQFLIYQKTNRCPKHLPLDPDVCYFFRYKSHLYQSLRNTNGRGKITPKL